MGKPPTLSIYHSGKFHEKVNLKDYTTSTSSSTKKELHDLFQEKGLELKSNEEIIAIKKAKDAEEELRRQLEEETNRKWEEKNRQKEKMIHEEIQRQKELYGHSVLEEEIKAGRKVDHRKSSRRLQEGHESPSDDETNPTSTYYHSSPTPPGAKRLVDFMDDEEKMRDKRRKEQREMQEKMREEYLKKTAEMNEQRQLEKERRRGAERRRNLEQLELLVDGMAPKEEQQATLLKERKIDDEDRGDESIKKGDRTRESARGTDHQKQTGMEL